MICNCKLVSVDFNAYNTNGIVISKVEFLHPKHKVLLKRVDITLSITHGPSCCTLQLVRYFIVDFSGMTEFKRT